MDCIIIRISSFPAPSVSVRSLASLNISSLVTLSAPKHHFASVKNDLISYTKGFYNENVHETASIITIYLFRLPPTSSHLHPLQVENCDSNSRLLVDEDDKDKLRPERVLICSDPDSIHVTRIPLLLSIAPIDPQIMIISWTSLKSATIDLAHFPLIPSILHKISNSLFTQAHAGKRVQLFVYIHCCNVLSILVWRCFTGEPSAR